MADGDLLVADHQYQLGDLLIGAGGLWIDPDGDGVKGWGDPTVRSSDEPYELADGDAGGIDTNGPSEITIPLLIACDTETDARALLATVRAAFAAGADRELHRRVAGTHEWVTGRTRGCTSVTRHIGAGVAHVLASFRALDPTVHTEAP